MMHLQFYSQNFQKILTLKLCQHLNAGSQSAADKDVPDETSDVADDFVSTKAR